MSHTARRILRGTAAVALLVALTFAGAARAEGPPAAAASELALVSQTPIVAPGQTFSLTFRADRLEPQARIELDVHDRVRSRSELTRAIAGKGLRAVRATYATSLDQLARDDTGLPILRVLVGDPAGVAITTPGVYPITVTAGDGSTAATSTLASQLVVPPATADVQVPLDVAVVADVSTEPALGPDGSPRVGTGDLTHLAGVVAALATDPAQPVTLAAGPDTIDVLAAANDPARSALADAVRSLATSHLTLARPYVDVAPDAFAAGNLGDELTHQVAHGEAVLRDLLHVDPAPGTWLDGSDLGTPGLDLLESMGIRRVVVTAGQVASASDGVFTLARPFRLDPVATKGTSSAPAARSSMTALLADPSIAEHLRSDLPPGAIATRVVAELAALWFEQPSVARATPIIVGRSTPPDAVAALRGALGSAGFLRPVELHDAFADATPLASSNGSPRGIRLAAGDPAAFHQDTVGDLHGARDRLTSLASLVGQDSDVLTRAETSLLRAEADGLSTAARSGELRAAEKAVGAITGAVTTAGTATITLTARSGNVPLTIINDSGTPLAVVVHLRSTKLDVPEGRDVPVTLAEGATRLDVAVRTRASGSIPLEVVVTSTDGRLVLASARYSVQSAAVSGVGIFLSGGAILFLGLWWGRHWREHRRSTKLVGGDGATVRPSLRRPGSPPTP